MRTISLLHSLVTLHEFSTPEAYLLLLRRAEHEPLIKLAKTVASTPHAALHREILVQHEASSWINYSEDQHQGWVCSLKNIQYPTLQNPSQRLNTNWYSENGKFSGYALGPGNPMILGIHSWMRCSQWGLVALFLPGFDALHLIVQVCGTVENLVLHSFMVDGAVRRLSQRECAH